MQLRLGLMRSCNGFGTSSKSDSAYSRRFPYEDLKVDGLSVGKPLASFIAQYVDPPFRASVEDVSTRLPFCAFYRR